MSWVALKPGKIVNWSAGDANEQWLFQLEVHCLRYYAHSEDLPAPSACHNSMFIFICTVFAVLIPPDPLNLLVFQLLEVGSGWGIGSSVRHLGNFPLSV